MPLEAEENEEKAGCSVTCRVNWRALLWVNPMFSKSCLKCEKLVP
jgi:hypothetical protein